MCQNGLNFRGMREVCPHPVPGVDISTYFIGLGMRLLNSACLPHGIEASVCRVCVCGACKARFFLNKRSIVITMDGWMYIKLFTASVAKVFVLRSVLTSMLLR